MLDDQAYISSRPDLTSLLQRKWGNTIYQKTYSGIAASELVNGIFIKRRELDDRCFTEQLSDHMQRNESKI